MAVQALESSAIVDELQRQSFVDDVSTITYKKQTYFTDQLPLTDDNVKTTDPPQAAACRHVRPDSSAQSTLKFGISVTNFLKQSRKPFIAARWTGSIPWDPGLHTVQCFQQVTQLNSLTPTVVIMGTAIKHPAPDRVKTSFVIFDIQALWHSRLSVRVPVCQKLQMTTA